MPYTVKQFQPTPNPNAVKCILDRQIAPAPVSFRAPPPGDPASQAPDSEVHRLAAALFGLPGVSGLLFNDDWLTVNKTPEAEWSAIKAGVKRTLASHP